MLNNFNYKKASKEFIPQIIKYLFIAESPPKDYRNFFFYTGEEKGNYCFFQNLILATLEIKYQRTIYDKRKLLNSFKDQGFYLIDAVEFPINFHTNDERKEILTQNKPSLIERLQLFNESGVIDSKTKIILIKNLVCEVLKDFLETNKKIIFDRSFGIECPGYPGYYSDQRFINKLKNIIS